jgi:hypothetical protein
MQQAAAVVFAIVTLGVIAFQLALAAGAPWGEYAMAGAFPGRLPPRMRTAAVGQAVLLAVTAVIVLSAAGFVLPDVADRFPWLIWLVVAFSGLAAALNSISPSAPERRVWVPVTLVMLFTSLIVAVGG